MSTANPDPVARPARTDTTPGNTLAAAAEIDPCCAPPAGAAACGNSAGPEPGVPSNHPPVTAPASPPATNDIANVPSTTPARRRPDRGGGAGKVLSGAVTPA
ncbi:hypothetical protein GCM10009745_51150 [Kribbella yunnanensis]|uniref:Uncharacterized protein n=1 Tax=Kribbella yunnanensis TaxID=190194 RepID=A0ABP4U5A3_9ACTN